MDPTPNGTKRDKESLIKAKSATNTTRKAFEKAIEEDHGEDISEIIKQCSPDAGDNHDNRQKSHLENFLKSTRNSRMISEESVEPNQISGKETKLSLRRDLSGSIGSKETKNKLIEFTKSKLSNFFPGGLVWLASLSLICVSIYLLMAEDLSTFQARVSGRALLYLSLLKPLWTLAQMLKYLGTYLLSFFRVINARLEGKLVTPHLDKNSLLSGAILFAKRYRRVVRVLFWSVLNTLSWMLIMNPDRSAIPDDTRIDFTDWEENGFLIILRLHILYAVYSLGRLCVNYFAFKHLYQFYSAATSDKVTKSIFEEAVLLAIAGVDNPTAALLLPAKYTNADAKNKDMNIAMDHISTRYLLTNMMNKVVASNFGLFSDDVVFTKNHVFTKIKSHLRQAFKQKNNILDAEENTEDPINKDKLWKTSELFKNMFLETPENSPKIGTERATNEKYPVGDDINEDKVFIDVEWLRQHISSHFPGGINIDEALKTIDASGSNRINVTTLKSFIGQVFRNRRNVAESLRGSDKISSQVQSGLQIIANILTVFIGFIIFEADILSSALSFSSALLGLSFIFGTTFSSWFENIAFLFGTHPFDVGDRIQLGKDSTVYTVKAISIQVTVLESVAKETRYMLNSILSKVDPLVNLSRSSGNWHDTSYVVDSGVVTAKFLEQVRADMKEYIESRPDLYSGYFRVEYKDFEPPLKSKLRLCVILAFSGANPGKAVMAHSDAALVFLESLTRHGGTKYTTYLRPFEDSSKD